MLLALCDVGMVFINAIRKYLINGFEYGVKAVFFSKLAYHILRKL